MASYQVLPTLKRRRFHLFGVLVTMAPMKLEPINKELMDAQKPSIVRIATRALLLPIAGVNP
jgi:hypothetical protein